MQVHCKDEKGLEEVARVFLSCFPKPQVVALQAPMGFGKTTFIKVLIRTLGAKEEGSSPTFAIVNEYPTAAGDIIYHFDCYRIKTPFEALDFGMEEYLDSGKWCFVEWPENVEALLPDDSVMVKIQMDANARIFEW